MLKYKVKSISLWVLAVALLSVATMSCKKDDPTVVVITIIDTAGKLVDSATVRLYGRSTDSNFNVTDIRFDSVRITNAAGQARWDLSEYTKPGQAGFAVLDITAFKDDLLGVGIVNVEEEKTTNQTVRIQ